MDKGEIMLPVLYVVIPCYNEEKVLPITSKQFLEVVTDMIQSEKIHPDSKILFVNDGSKDTTWQVIENLSKSNACYQGISLSRNRGHQNALLAGLMKAKEYADITISIDCDGQDDICAMKEMVDAYHKGAEIVYGVRSKRKTDTWFKRFTAEGFYHVMNKLGADIVFNHADYRLISKRVLDELEKYKEVNIFLRGLVPMVGFNSTSVYYEREERIAGESHYPLKKMISFALDGITSLSVKPIHLITAVGSFVSVLGFAGIIWAIIMNVLGKTIAGWASIICIVCFLGGIQLISLGVIGEYIGKIYMETKARPRYIIEKGTSEMVEGHPDRAISDSK